MSLESKVAKFAIAFSIAAGSPAIAKADQIPNPFSCSDSTEPEVVRHIAQPEELEYFRDRFAVEIDPAIDTSFFNKDLTDPANSNLESSYRRLVRDCPQQKYKDIQIVEIISYTVYKKDYLNPIAKFEEGSTANGFKYRSIEILIDENGVNRELKPAQRYSNAQLEIMANKALTRPVNHWEGTDSRASFDNRLSYDIEEENIQRMVRAFSTGRISIYEEYQK